MKVLIIADGNSSHTIKWIVALSKQQVDVSLWSLSPANHNVYKELGITHKHAGISQSRTNIFDKIKYITALSSLKSCLNEIKPHLLHAHYASSYGLLGTLAGFKPFIVSVWGADVYDFPKKNSVFKSILIYNLKAADKILSTSHVMATETRKYTDKDITVTPFGVDLELFDPTKYVRDGDKHVFTIGTIKSLEDKYGINYLIQAFAIFKQRQVGNDVRLLIVGKGSKESALKNLAKELEVDTYCDFINAVPQHRVPYYYSNIDVGIFPSILDSESFGVAAVEASAMCKPTIVSSVGGLNEVVVDGITGIKVKPKNVKDLAKAIEYLYLNAEIREKMGRAGRNRVRELYHWPDNVQQMIKIYEQTIIQ
ncbi:glycosyltransferase [Parapedobacter deserti]|uniref:Glycosyltransferase n=1 Tax=Parapedobacter deserti TaxID=1912957 RepID=A0ABV7JJQ3_9SPHI